MCSGLLIVHKDPSGPRVRSTSPSYFRLTRGASAAAIALATCRTWLCRRRVSCARLLALFGPGEGHCRLLPGNKPPVLKCLFPGKSRQWAGRVATEHERAPLHRPRLHAPIDPKHGASAPSCPENSCNSDPFVVDASSPFPRTAEDLS